MRPALRQAWVCQVSHHLELIEREETANVHESSPIHTHEEIPMRSRQRVADYGEVFTPAWMVDAMLDLVRSESERIDARFLEPACGSGNFLVPVLRRKLASVQSRHGKSEFEKNHHALLALMSIYGIELLADNTNECRDSLLGTFTEFVGDNGGSWHRAATAVLNVNIVQGDALTMTAADGTPITFPEWGYLGKGKFQRRDFRYETLTTMSSWDAGTLFGDLGKHELFTPVRQYPTMTVEEIHP